jgi:chloramphenicol 3-O phosphotransferase
VTLTTIIILNGISSVGKSSAARELQKITQAPFLHVRGDSFLEMLPPQMYGHEDGITLNRLDESMDAAIEIHMGSAVRRLLMGFRYSVATLAAQGNNLIVDDVMLDATDQDIYEKILHPFAVYFVGLHAPLATLEKRERNRKNRIAGLAKWQQKRVHEGIKYDLELQTSKIDAADIAKKIADVFKI